jgi:hypothetical protein
MPTGIGADAPIELRQSACARIARVDGAIIDEAMRLGALPFWRDAEGKRVTTYDKVVEWMRNGGVAK